MTNKRRKTYVHPTTTEVGGSSDELMWFWSVPVGDPDTEDPPSVVNAKGYTVDESYPFDVDYLNVSEYEEFSRWGSADNSKWPYNAFN